MMPGSKFSWMTHVLGLESLFASQGPLAAEDRTPLDQALLDLCRPLMILVSFFTQKPSLMSEPGWQIVKQSQGPDQGACWFQGSVAGFELSFLMGILAELPALFLRCDDCVRIATTKCCPPSPADVSTIWSRVRQLQQDLQAWEASSNYDGQEKVIGSLPLQEVDLTLANDVGWTTVFSFKDMEHATTFNMYHTAIILLTSIPISLLEAGLFDPHPSDFSIWNHNLGNASQSLSSKVKTSVHSICRSIEYYICVQEPMRPPADYYIFFPIHVARRASLRMALSPELSFLNDASKRMRLRYPTGVWANMDLDNRFSGYQEGLFG